MYLKLHNQISNNYNGWTSRNYFFIIHNGMLCEGKIDEQTETEMLIYTIHSHFVPFNND